MKLEFLDVVESEYYANCLYALIDESFKQMISLAVKDVHDLMPLHGVYCMMSQHVYKITTLLQQNDSKDNKKHLYTLLLRLVSEFVKFNFDQSDEDKIKRVSDMFADYCQTPNLSS